MQKFFVVFGALVALAACPPPPCTRSAVSVSSSRVNEFVALENQTIEHVVTFGASSCAYPDDTLIVTATYVDSLERSHPVTVSNVAHLTGQAFQGSVSAKLSFNAGAAGIGTLKIVAEPNIERTSMPVLVAIDATKLRSFDEARRCSKPQRMRSGLTVCELFTSYTVWRGDVMVGTIPGTAAQVAGDSLWVTRTADSVVERYEGFDGGLVRTHVSPTFPTSVGNTSTRSAHACRHGRIFVATDAGTLDIVDGDWGAAKDFAPTGFTYAVRRDEGLCFVDGGCDPLTTNFSGAFDTGWWEYDLTTTTLLATTLRPSGLTTLAAVPGQFPEPPRDVAGRYRPVFDTGTLTMVVDWRNDGGLALYGFPTLTPFVNQAGDFGSFALPDGSVRFVEFPQ